MTLRSKQMSIGINVLGPDLGNARDAARVSRFSAASLWRSLQRPGLVLAALFVALLAIAAIHPEWLSANDPLGADAQFAFLPPGAGHLLGTDENGRDVLTRLIYGARPSLIMGVCATAISLVGGVVLGLLAGLGHRAIDSAVMRLIDVLLAFPDLLLALVIIAFWGQGEFNAILGVGLASVPRHARMVRVQTRVVRSAQYVEAARTLGIGGPRLVLRHVLPNAVKPILILSIISIGGQITAGAALSFLGLGAPPPSPEWGSMLSTGREFLANAWWLTAMPGIAITLTVVSITALGRELLRRREGKR